MGAPLAPPPDRPSVSVEPAAVPASAVPASAPAAVSAELADPVTIRAYRPLDHSACRELWVELVRAERDRYHDPKRGGPDPGAGFEEYLTRLDLTGLWVAEHDDESVVGLIGLVLGPGRSGAVGPIVVADRLRGRGIGRALLDHVSQEARRRGMAYLSVTPASRNEEAIRSFHAAGYHALASVTLALDLTPRDYEWRDGVDLHGLRFSY